MKKIKKISTPRWHEKKMVVNFLAFEEKRLWTQAISFDFILAITSAVILRAERLLVDCLRDKSILKSTLKYWALGLAIMIASSLVISLFNIPTSDNQNTNIELFKQAPIIQSMCAIIFAPIFLAIPYWKNKYNIRNNYIIYVSPDLYISGFWNIL